MPGKVVKKKSGSKILGSLSPLYGIATGKGAFGKLAKAGLSPAGMLAKKMKKNKQAPVAATARANTGGKQIPEGPEGNGLRALKKKNPELVKERLGYAKRGGVMKMQGGGSTCRGMGAAIKGGNFNRNG
tara:strand:+ start:3249 stop:3635 length:387 start_codon:yes stop_codon:yes gene_type:complete